MYTDEFSDPLDSDSMENDLRDVHSYHEYVIDYLSVINPEYERLLDYGSDPSILLLGEIEFEERVNEANKGLGYGPIPSCMLRNNYLEEIESKYPRRNYALRTIIDITDCILDFGDLCNEWDFDSDKIGRLKKMNSGLIKLTDPVEKKKLTTDDYIYALMKDANRKSIVDVRSNAYFFDNVIENLPMLPKSKRKKMNYYLTKMNYYDNPRILLNDVKNRNIYVENLLFGGSRGKKAMLKSLLSGLSGQS